jgi:general secretion pathway protein A
MYESYWNLRQKPFENCLDPRFYFPGESHQAAILKLRYAVENRRAAALLAGASGTGKTLIVSMLREALGEEFAPFVHLVFPQMTAAELLSYLAGQLDGADGHSGVTPVPESVHRIEAFLTENSRQGRHAVIVVDEAHLLDNARTFEALRLLLNFEPDGHPGLTLLLVGQTGLLPTLDRLPQLEERLGVKSLIRPFSQQETADYVDHRLKVAGGQRAIFDPDALATLHELTQGVARRINRLCDLALLIGYAEQQQAITAEHFESVCREMVAVAPE